MSESENKNLVVRLFESLSTGDIDAALELMNNDAVHWVSGKPKQFPLAGTYTKRQLAAVLHSGACYAQRDDGEHHRDDGVYENKLFYAFEFRNEKIHSGRKYLDTIHANEVLAQR
jgi:uncharacterized protein